VNDAQVDSINFVYAVRRYVLTGRIVQTFPSDTTLRRPLGGIVVRLRQSGVSNVLDSAITDSLGRFSLRVNSLSYGGISLTLFVNSPLYTFRYRGDSLGAQVSNGFVVGVLRDDAILDDIIAVQLPPRRFPVTGRLLYPDGKPVLEQVFAIITNASTVVSPSLVTERQELVRIDSSGSYTFSVTSGAFRVSLVSNRLVFFTPLVTIIMPNDSTRSIDLQATLKPFTVSGSVRTLLAEPIGGALLQFTANNSSVSGLTARTDSNGSYSVVVSRQFPGSSFTIIPRLDTTIFTPANRLVIANIATTVVNNLDFRATSTVATLPLSSIAGRVIIRTTTGQDIGLQGVSIADGTRAVRTDANGGYVLRNVPNGVFTLTPTFAGYSFTPPTINASVIAGNGPRGQNFIAQIQQRDTANRAPFVITPLNDIPVVAAATKSLSLVPVFTDPDGDSLAITTSVEDPTILRTRLRGGQLLLDALTEGNTIVNVVASDNRGGVATASFRISVSPPVATPQLFVRPKGNLNTNINAAVILETKDALLFAEKGDVENITAGGGELGAFNSKCECVGSIVWSGENAVLAVWGENKESKIPGMAPNDPLHLRFIDNTERKSRRTRIAYIERTQSVLWPIDNAVITSIPEFNNEPCQVLSSVYNAQVDANLLALQVHPNPTASRAQLSYTLPVSGASRVEVWNMYGQCVKVLWNGIQQSGNHRLDIDVDALPSGMYICRVHSGEGTAKTVTSAMATIRLTIIR
jgi:hypothetical protein